MENFTPLSSAFGGLLIGLSASLLLFGIGRVAGISGILSGVFTERTMPWRRYFLVGLIATGTLLSFAHGDFFINTTTTSLPMLIVAGLLVGFGTRLGSGCTSGHGVCGLPRLSLRSLVAVGTFIGAGIATTSALRVFGLLS